MKMEKKNPGRVLQWNMQHTDDSSGPKKGLKNQSRGKNLRAPFCFVSRRPKYYNSQWQFIASVYCVVPYCY